MDGWMDEYMSGWMNRAPEKANKKMCYNLEYMNSEEIFL
jgi:hypothetical protein